MTHTPDIMEKARELAKQLINHGIDCAESSYREPNYDQAADLIAAALAEARAVPQWLPIESAPMDEMFIWGYWKGEKFSIGLAYQTVSNTWRDAYGDPKAKGATHWQPLPAAPNPPIAGGGE